uniref:Uncharacterized protein n=1 Tax=Ciona savignyi TaxID=51511 RepID=H2YTY7_CIOSA
MNWVCAFSSRNDPTFLTRLNKGSKSRIKREILRFYSDSAATATGSLDSAACGSLAAPGGWTSSSEGLKM